MRTLQGTHDLQIVFTWPRTHFMDQWTRLSFDGQVHISDTLTNRSSIFTVWKNCKVYMSNWQVSSDVDLIFMVQWLYLSFCLLVCFSYTVCNRCTIFGVWNDCKVNMSSWQVSSDLDLIFINMKGKLRLFKSDNNEQLWFWIDVNVLVGGTQVNKSFLDVRSL